MTTKVNGMTVLVTVLTVLVVAMMAWIAFRTLGGPNEAAIRQTAVECAQSGVQLRFGNQELVPAEISGTAGQADGSPVEFAQTGAQETAALLFTEAPDGLWFSTAPSSASVRVTDGAGLVRFEGTAEAFNAAFAPENGNYTVEITAAFDLDFPDQPDWRIRTQNRYTASVTYDIPVSFHLSADTVSQGDVLLFCADGLRDPAGLEVTVPFAYTPVLERTVSGCYAYIPFNYMRGEGEYTVDAVYNGQEMSFSYRVTEPDYEVQHLTISESTASSTVGNSTAVSEYNQTMDRLGEVYDSEIYWTADFIQPVSGTITTEFGIKRYTNNASTPTRHAGIDIAAAEGTPVAASNDGRVIFAGYLQVSGYTVVIEHGMGLHTMYLHMSALDCSEGDIVRQGEIIGKVGMTGFATGPHLHFQVQVGSMCVSPWYLFDGSSGVYKIREKS